MTTQPQSATKSWSTYMLDLYRGRVPPATGSLEYRKLEQAAREKLKDTPGSFMYVYGSAGTSSTYDANRKELDKWKIIPRMLRDATIRNVETTIFGVKYPSPVLVSPIGVQGLMHPEGELATAAAASKLGIPFIMSTASTRSIEAVAKANGNGPRWYQLYWPKSDDLTLSLLSRAKSNGFSALVITLDTMLLGWRQHDLDHAYLPFAHGVGAQIGFTDPVFMRRFNMEPFAHDDVPEFPYDPDKLDKLALEGDERMKKILPLAMAWLLETNSGKFKSWENLKFVRANWEGPLVLKGILSVKDAELALEAGVDGIVVSNHGGRQVDGAIPAIYALHQICSSPKIKEAQSSGKFTILFDSGIRSGSDVIKALALGAQGILYARPYMYALAIAGEAGVETAFKALLADLEITLGLSGYTDISEIQGKADEILVKID